MFLHRLVNRRRFANVAAFCATMAMILSVVPAHACCCTLALLQAQVGAKGSPAGPEARSRDEVSKLGELGEAESTKNGTIPACPRCTSGLATPASPATEITEATCELKARATCCSYDCDCCQRPEPQLTTLSLRESALAEIAVFSTPQCVVSSATAELFVGLAAFEPTLRISALQRRALLCCWLN
jgi:hypothetical protein